MAEKYLQGSFTIKDLSGNVIQVNSLTENDIAKIKGYFSKTDSLEQKLASENLGQKTLAYKDYRQELNQAEMVAGVYYMVPVNAADQFIEFDKTTGKPKVEQAEGVDDPKVVKYYVVYKSSGEEGTVATLGEIDQQPDFDLFGKLAADNTWTGNNTFNNDVKVANGASQDVNSIEDTVLVSGKIAKELNTKVKALESASATHITIQISELAPEEGSMTTNVLYGFKSKDLL